MISIIDLIINAMATRPTDFYYINVVFSSWRDQKTKYRINIAHWCIDDPFYYYFDKHEKKKLKLAIKKLKEDLVRIEYEK